MSGIQSMHELDSRIDEYMNNSPASHTITSLKDIKELSSYEWSRLASAMQLGELELRMMGPAPMCFHVVASPEQKSSHKLFTSLSLFTIPVSIVLSVIFSWWWLALLVLFPIFRGAAKSAYNQAIFGSALCTEKGFSFLFSRGAICLSGKEGLVFAESE